jgi:hypothetical protein
MSKKTDARDHLHSVAIKVAKFHFILAGLYIAQTVIFHASKVITPEVVLWRWYAVAALLATTTLVWLIVHDRHLTTSAYSWAIGAVIVVDLAFAAFNVYIQRGYASKSVVLFLIPIVVASALASRAALVGTALLAIATYTTTVVSYFVLNFNEGYMSEMYAEIGLYSGVFLLTAWLLWATNHNHS